MAKMGLRHPKYAVVTVTTDASGVETETFGTVKTAGRAVSADVSINASDAKFYADDSVAESDRAFIDGTLTMGVDDLGNATTAELTGAALDAQSGDIVFGEDDTAPYVRWGFIVPKMVRGARKFMGVIFLRVKFGAQDESYETKGDSVNFSGDTITGNIMKNAVGKWKRKSADLDTAAAADAWLDAALVAANAGG